MALYFREFDRNRFEFNRKAAYWLLPGIPYAPYQTTFFNKIIVSVSNVSEVPGSPLQRFAKVKAEILVPPKQPPALTFAKRCKDYVARPAAPRHT
ncbi:hypothetical protein Clacol_004464 [Clathrus columnatus]|uniref:Uncharacterized protein n=1 Tax=Clathrus columnatus TaxID=1419009 RepID=A0AAV5AAM1_9AGAM|nr:hypothetical protein Clacol_004464 [Clathrus columnatus]